MGHGLEGNFFLNIQNHWSDDDVLGPRQLWCDNPI